MGSPSNALNISNPGLVYFDGSYSFDGRLPVSSDNTINITVGATTIDFTASDSGDVQTLTGNSGVATASGGITANTTVKFVGTSGNLTEDFGISNLLIGSSGSSITSALANVSIGQFTLQALTSGIGNTCLGVFAGSSLTSGQSNVLIGSNAGLALTSSLSNIAIGPSALLTFTTGVGSAGTNIAIGKQSLDLLTTGTSNIAIGSLAGHSCTSSESNNILIGNAGVLGESTTIRIGNTALQTDCYLAGILHTTSGRTVNVTTPGAYPYTALTSDYIILVDTSAARTINLMATPATGTSLTIKDNVGTANTFNITITPAAGTIDGAASTTINIAWVSVDIFYNGTSWRIK